MRQTLKELKKVPIVVVFFAILTVATVADLATPTMESSALENRRLPQAPVLSWDSLTAEEEDRRWSYLYGEFVRDQFLFRDAWVSLTRALEAGQGKLELGGVWLAEDGYQVAQNSTWSTNQQRLLPLNTEAVLTLAQQNPGKVAAMIVPSPANILSDKLRWAPPQIDENALLDETFAAMAAGGVTVVDLRDVFTQNEAEGRQTYYRTDHHWTTTGGALLAYRAYCGALSLEGRLPPSELLVDVPGFLGTNYAKTLLPGTRPDVLQYYDLPVSMTVERTDPETGETLTEASGLMDKDKLATTDKYAAFLRGNNGYSRIVGKGEGSVLVIKDSYANSFVPYLVEQFGEIGVVDLRDRPTGVAEILKRDSYEHILVLYSFAAFSEDLYASRMVK